MAYASKTIPRRLDPETGKLARAGTPDSVQVLTTQEGGSLGVYRLKGLNMWLWRTSMSAGVSVAADPPNKIFSPEASRKLLTILYGPIGLSPTPPPIAEASVHAPEIEVQ